MNLNTIFRLRWVAAVALSGVLIGIVGLTPARADRSDYQRDHIYHDIADVRRDESMLRDLEDRRDEARRCHRYEEARSLDFRIRELRIHISDDRRDIHHDIDRARRDRDRDDRDRYRNSDYRYDDYHSNRDRNYRDRDNYSRDQYRTRY